MNARQPYLVDILNRKQKAQVHILIGLWTVSVAMFAFWWFQPLHITDPWLFGCNSFVLGWAILMPAYYFYFLRRMKAIAAAAALITTGAFVYAQVPQETDMAGAKHQVVFGDERVAPLSESVARRQTLTATEKVPTAKIAATDLNSTPAQLAQRYGKPVKVESSFFGKGTSYGFQPAKNTYVYATTDPSEAAIGGVLYFKFNGLFTQEEKEKLFQKNVDPTHVWEGYNYYNWDGTRDFKRLGVENGTHKVIREANGTGVVIGNDHKDDKSGTISYEVRTGEQFAFEEPIIKKLIEEQQTAGSVKGQVTVGKLKRID